MPKGDPAAFEPVTIEDAKGVRLSKSQLGLLVHVCGEAFWIPVSQIDDDSEVCKPDTEGKLIIPTWLAVEKGLEKYAS